MRTAALLLAAALPLSGMGVALAQSNGIRSPQPGVICDPGGPICYDRLGLSLGLTREFFGSYAEQQALRQLGGQAPPRVFRLSNGAVCDVDARRCWSDGWDRRFVDAGLSRQLFGQEASGTARLADCRLTRWFKVLSSGGCEVSERRGERGNRSIDVQLSDGTFYSFSRRRYEGYQVTDRKGGTWPVRISDQGRSLSFSWADRVLQITPQRQPREAGSSLEQLFESLLND